MNFAAMTTTQLLQHDRNIGHHLDRVNIAANPEKAREWIKARREVRRTLEARNQRGQNN
jgi:hypothetical protein